MPDLATATLADSVTLAKILWFITVLSLLVERSLSLVFEHRIWVTMEKTFTGSGLKEILATALCWYICRAGNFDAFGIMFTQPPSTFGIVLTACMIAGGSKGMLKLMRDVLGVSKAASAPPASRRKRA